VVAISGDFQHAAALCPHALTLSREPYSNNFCYYWNPSTHTTDALTMQAENDLLLARTQILQMFSSDAQLLSEMKEAGLSASLSILDGTLVLTSGNVDAKFDLSSEEDMMFIAEIAMVFELKTQLSLRQYKELALDDAPDHFSISFSSLKKILIKYGRESPQFKLALELVDLLIVNFVHKMEHLYEGQLMVEISLLGTKEIDCQHLISDSVKQTIDLNYLPQIVPTYPIAETTTIAQDLKLSTQDSKIELIQQNPVITRHYKRSINANNGNLTINPYQLSSFQICFWTPIVITIIIIIVVYAMSQMSGGKDTLLLHEKPSSIEK